MIPGLTCQNCIAFLSQKPTQSCIQKKKKIMTSLLKDSYYLTSLKEMPNYTAALANQEVIDTDREAT